MRLALFALIAASLIGAFQNCAPDHASLSSGSLVAFDITGNYPFSNDQKYFADVQLVKVDHVSSGFNYQFNSAVAPTDSSELDFLVRLRILDEQNADICAPIVASANRLSNSFEITDCRSASAKNKIYVQVEAKNLTDSEYTLVQSYEFLPPH